MIKSAVKIIGYSRKSAENRSVQRLASRGRPESRSCCSSTITYLFKSTSHTVTYLLRTVQGLWRIEYLNTGRAETTICKQIGGGHDFTYHLFVR